MVESLYLWVVWTIMKDYQLIHSNLAFF